VVESDRLETSGKYTNVRKEQLSQLLLDHGMVVANAYFGFFIFGLWRFRRDTSPIGLVASTEIFGSFVASLW
jgi:hypothetical protein